MAFAGSACDPFLLEPARTKFSISARIYK